MKSRVASWTSASGKDLKRTAGVLCRKDAGPVLFVCVLPPTFRRKPVRDLQTAATPLRPQLSLHDDAILLGSPSCDTTGFARAQLGRPRLPKSS